MTDKTMPERVWLNFEIGYDGGTEWGYEKITDKDAEYIRADLVPAPSSTDEPLEAGQRRWAKIHADDCWEMVVVRRGTGGLLLTYRGEYFKPHRWEVIGPVIQPPADNLSN